MMTSTGLLRVRCVQIVLVCKIGSCLREADKRKPNEEIICARFVLIREHSEL